MRPPSLTSRERAVRQRRSEDGGRSALVLATVVLAITLLPPSATAADGATLEVATPTYTSGDWFEYAGHDESVVAELAELMANGSVPEDVDVNWSMPLRVEYSSTGSCVLGVWTGECTSAKMRHGLNATVRWPAGTSGYSNDTMVINVSLEVDIEEPADRRAFASARSSTQTIRAWFTAGGEDSVLEIEVFSNEEWERKGDWPSIIHADSVWAIEETIHREGWHRTRMNGGPWNETERHRNESSSSTWRANGTATVHTGWDSSVEMNAMRIRIEPVASGEWTELMLHPAGYPISTTTYADGTPRSTLILLTHSYRAEQSVDVVVSGRGLGVMGWLSIILGVVVVTALILAAVRVSRRVAEGEIGSSGLPRHVLDSIAGAVGGDVYEEMRGARDEAGLGASERGEAGDAGGESEANRSGGILAMAEERFEAQEEAVSGLPSEELSDG